MRIFLDNCSLNRPWDDQGQIRVHREAESVLFLIEEALDGRIELVSSDYLVQEITRISDTQRRERVMGLLDAASLHVSASTALVSRAIEFAPFSIVSYDALHLAAAEFARCSWVVTTDDKLLKRCSRASNFTSVRAINPADWPLPTP